MLSANCDFAVLRLHDAPQDLQERAARLAGTLSREWLEVTSAIRG
jgi:hypothetical protein